MSTGSTDLPQDAGRDSGAKGSGADSAGNNTPDNTPPAQGGWGAWLRDRSELGVSLLLLAVGVLVLGDMLTMETVTDQRGPVGPRTVPLLVGAGLLLVAVVLAVDVLRGGRAATDEEDDTGGEPTDWRTVALLAGIFLASAALIEPLGFPVTGALLFWGSAYALGSRNFTRDPLIAAVLSMATYAAFNTLLGVPLPGGPLMGVL